MAEIEPDEREGAAVFLSRRVGEVLGYLNSTERQRLVRAAVRARSVDDLPDDLREWVLDPSTIPAEAGRRDPATSPPDLTR